jgi:anhydro-N-acetylmuramic acid kinase
LANHHSRELFIGIMSGTSLDGVDAVLARFDKEKPQLLAHSRVEFDAALHRGLLSLNHKNDNELETAQVLSNELARCYANACSQLLQSANLAPRDISAIGCHGQTVRHRPDLSFTLQLNNPSLLAELTHISVVADFRARDVAAGGQGAPLVPAFHSAVFGDKKIHRAVVNIGGISNLTDLPVDGSISGFDCGPGNVLMDAWIQQHHGVPFDRDGAWALGGRVQTELLQKMLAEKYFFLPPPKSTGRDLFSLPWLLQFLNNDMQPQDVQTTLLALTAQTIIDAIQRHAAGAKEIFFCGGGARNRTLIQALEAALAPAKVRKTDELGIDAEHVEALAFAWLARQTVNLKTGNVPAVTGARGERILGGIYPA